MWVGIGDRCLAPSRSYKAWEKGSLSQNFFNSFSNMNRGRFLDCCLIGAHSSRRVGALEGYRHPQEEAGALGGPPGHPATSRPDRPSRRVLSCPLPTGRPRAGTDVTWSLVTSVGSPPAHPIPLNVA